MSLERDICKVLAYFDIFHYPVTANEIRAFLSSTPKEEDLVAALDRLYVEKRIFNQDNLYFLRDEPGMVYQRRSDNRRAQVLMKTAYKISRFLFQFPYVRGIGISGSLSKNVADENADIDFFIITKSNRLWISRTIMHLFKKLTFLFRKQHLFCMNYYIDEEELQITDKNIYTATEVVTLVPVCGNGVLNKFFEANSWTQAFFPNYHLFVPPPKKTRSSIFKTIIEFLLNNKLGELLDNHLMRITSERWDKKELNEKRNVKGGRMGLRTGKHYSKPNPAFFQQKVLLIYEDKLKQIDKVLTACIVN